MILFTDFAMRATSFSPFYLLLLAVLCSQLVQGEVNQGTAHGQGNEVDTDTSSEEDPTDTSSEDDSDSGEELEVDSDVFISSNGTFNETDTSTDADTDTDASSPEFSQYRSTLYFDHLLQLIKDENTTESFVEEAASLREENAPDIKELTDMFNEISNGVIPQYLINNNFSLMANASAYYNYSDTNQGNVNSYGYGVLEDKGDVGTHSSLEFNIINGSIMNFSYAAGTSFYIHTRYTKSDSSVQFQSSILGSIVFLLPSGVYYSHGNFTGIGQGNAVSFSVNEMDSSSQTAAIFHTSQYYSRSVLFNNVKTDRDLSTTKLDLISLTGGTNGTLNMHSQIIPGMEENFNGTIDGTLENPGKSATLIGAIQGALKLDPSGTFSGPNLHHLFEMVRTGDDVYLP